ncbi:hypothetical protein [Pseudomonas taetrolens]
MPALNVTEYVKEFCFLKQEAPRRDDEGLRVLHSLFDNIAAGGIKKGR